jgi:chemotaxis signal transduction protein
VFCGSNFGASDSYAEGARQLGRTLARENITLVYGGTTKGLMGVVADAVSQVVDIAADDVEPAPSFGTRIRVDFLKGMAHSGRKFVLMLDVDRVLTTHELLAAAGTGQPGSPQEEMTA